MPSSQTALSTLNQAGREQSGAVVPGLIGRLKAVVADAALDKLIAARDVLPARDRRAVVAALRLCARRATQYADALAKLGGRGEYVADIKSRRRPGAGDGVAAEAAA